MVLKTSKCPARTQVPDVPPAQIRDSEARTLLQEQAELPINIEEEGARIMEGLSPRRWHVQGAQSALRICISHPSVLGT